MIYLDYAADTPVSETALSAFASATHQYGANPNSSHALGLAARTRLDEATARIARMLGAEPDEIVMTSGATEANNLAILGAARAYQSRGRHLITTPMEHSSVTGPMSQMKAEGFELGFVKILPNGRVNLDHLISLMRPDTILVSVCAVDSEVGVIQPVEAVKAAMERFPNCRLHVDATQAVGKLPLALDGADLVTLSPHKFYGLTGSGVLVVRGGMRLMPIWYGGDSATPYRSGTPALALTVAAEAALSEALSHLEERFNYVTRLNHKLRGALGGMDHVVLNSPAEASPFILNVSLTGMRARDVIGRLSEKGICVSSKSACCAPVAPSRPVMAMTGDRKRAQETVRISLSHLTANEEIDQFLEAFSSSSHA